jgi:hypothetical protein
VRLEEGEINLPSSSPCDKEATMKKRKRIFISLLLVAAMMICITGEVFAEEETGFGLSQSKDTVSPGEELVITLNGQNLKDLYAYEAVLSYDPDIVELIKAESKLDGFFITPKNENGELTIAFTKIGKTAGEKGNVALCTVAFKGKAQGNANVKLVSVKALDTNLKATVFENNVKIKTFNDLAGFEWARMYIEHLATLGIIAGTSETTYSPGLNITRADFVCLLVRTLKLTAEVDSNFDDVVERDHFYKEVGIAKKLGIAAGGGNNQFKPRESISRQDMMALVSRAMKVAGKDLDGSGADLSTFQDSNEIADYAISAVKEVANEGIIVGNNGILNPRGNVTRAQAAVVMYKILYHN